MDADNDGYQRSAKQPRTMTTASNTKPGTEAWTDGQNQGLQEECEREDGATHCKGLKRERETDKDVADGIFQSKRKLKETFRGAVCCDSNAEEEDDKADNTTMAVSEVSPPSDLDEVYDFGHSKRGRAIIINNEKFKSRQWSNRDGSCLDAWSLQDLFKRLKFDVKRHDDLTASEMKEELKKGADNYDHSNADCLVVAILSHGGLELEDRESRQSKLKNVKMYRECVYGIDGATLFTSDVTALFQDSVCPGLRGKPRLFFIQACRGELYDDGVDIRVIGNKSDTTKGLSTDTEAMETDALGSSGKNAGKAISRVQLFKDFLVMNATPPDHYAWRRKTEGSWFIRSLCEVLTKEQVQQTTARKPSLMRSLTHVSMMVAHWFESDHKYAKRKKQVPVVDSMLTKEIFFTKN